MFSGFGFQNYREIYFLDPFSDEEEIFNKKLLDINKAFTNIQQQLHLMRKPIGTRENPARTCRDLFYGHPDLKDGTALSSYHCVRDSVLLSMIFFYTVEYEKLNIES